MALRATHELHERRKGRNLGVGLLLIGFIGIVFGLTVVKVQQIGAVQGFDHVLRPELVPQAAPAEPGAPVTQEAGQ